MNTEIILHANDLQDKSAMIYHEIDKNIIGKLDAYIRKTVKEGDKIRIELTLIRDKIGITGKLIISFPGGIYRSARENFLKLEDLINHLFSHVKEQMGK
ncbi:hypothetical protein H7169_02070 [Candidatus Gracilibacteria bacterium]|nr:hypothetical protein [Candidatus Gracilibacteria bacterium]